jgi:hypothetical protein
VLSQGTEKTIFQHISSFLENMPSPGRDFSNNFDTGCQHMVSRLSMPFNRAGLVCCILVFDCTVQCLTLSLSKQNYLAIFRNVIGYREQSLQTSCS